MNIQPIQRRVLPSVLSAKKSLPQGVLKKGVAVMAAATTITAAKNQKFNLNVRPSSSDMEVCGSLEAYCTVGCSF